MEDAVLAQLLGMGFESKDIKECHRELSAQGGGTYSLQAATEWLLQHQQRQSATSQHQDTSSSGRLVLTTPTAHLPQDTTAPSGEGPPSLPSDVQRALSSTSDLSSHSQSQTHNLKSRYNLGDDHSRDKERFAAKEREEAVKKARESRLADIKARQQLKQQIAEDRKAKQERMNKLSPTESNAPRPLQEATALQSSHDSHVIKSPDMCRVQIRLPNGRMLRHNFIPTASLDDVAVFVQESCPEYSSVQLVQPFPHHEFTDEEYQCSLTSLNLCPSASLVVAKQPRQEVGGASNTSETHPPPSSESPNVATTSSSSHFEHDQMAAAASHMDTRQNRVTFGNSQRSEYKVQMPGDKGHRLGGNEPEEGEDSVQPMEVEEEEREEEEMPDEDSMEADLPRPHVPGIVGGNVPPPLPRPFPPHGGPHPLGMGGPRVVPGGMFRGLGVADDSFEGAGHRLGGKEGPVMLGDLQRHADRMRDAARSAAVKRSQVPSTTSTPHHPHTLTDRGPPSLEALSTRALISSSRSYGLPSCGGLTPLVAQKLMMALKNEKRLNPKTLAAFHGCPVQVIELDNYIYTTNELLLALCYFPSLTQLSLGSCTIVTDKAVMSLLPYLTGLTHLSLNGCRQLNEITCRSIRRCENVEVLKLSEVKVSDRGVALLVHTPLLRLRELDLSRTQITAKSLELLPNGTPNLETLSVEGTSVDHFTALSQLPRLTTLNIAHCPTYSDIGSLCVCRGLQSLSLVGLSVETSALQQLATDLHLTTLKLPDRNTFFDDGVKAVSAFPLLSLNLMDYCHVTDMGISHVSHMTMLRVLSLSRTKLTDQGMVYLEGMTGLRELSVDNTLVSDVGITFISRLTGLDVLSLSDTRVTSQFIIDGVLDGLHMLTKLNLSRTAVCDRGVMRLRLCSLLMLNINWTCATEESSMEYLRNNGCPLLEVLGNSNIGQPLPGQQLAIGNQD